jgi:hypothetical protein
MAVAAVADGCCVPIVERWVVAQGDGGELDNDLADLQAVGGGAGCGRGRGRGRGLGRSGPSASDRGDDFEFEHEGMVAMQVRDAVRDLSEEMTANELDYLEMLREDTANVVAAGDGDGSDSDSGMPNLLSQLVATPGGGLPSGSSSSSQPLAVGGANASSSSTGAASSSAGAPPAPAAHDWAQYDQYMFNVGPGRCDVRKDGSPLGQLQQIGPGDVLRYVCAARCAKHGPACSRMRTWRVGREQPEHVDRVLTRWLVDGFNHNTAWAHKQDHRY